METVLPYVVLLTFTHNEYTISNKLIATFYNIDDAYDFARRTCQYYIDCGDKAIVTVKHHHAC